jgi:hypothetical protein
VRVRGELDAIEASVPQSRIVTHEIALWQEKREKKEEKGKKGRKGGRERREVVRMLFCDMMYNINII